MKKNGGEIVGRYYVYNTVTGKYEFIDLSEPVHSELKQWNWRQEKQDVSIHKHEVMVSELHGDYETFREFADITDVEDDAIKLMMIKQLHICIEQLTENERELISALFFYGMTEREYADLIGQTQQNINKKKQRILSKLYKLLVE